MYIENSTNIFLLYYLEFIRLLFTNQCVGIFQIYLSKYLFQLSTIINTLINTFFVDNN